MISTEITDTINPFGTSTDFENSNEVDNASGIAEHNDSSSTYETDFTSFW